MMATMPMLGLLTIWALKKVRPHASTMSFILLSFSGVVLVITNGDVFAVLNSPISLAANLLLIAGALFGYCIPLVEAIFRAGARYVIQL